MNNTLERRVFYSDQLGIEAHILDEFFNSKAFGRTDKFIAVTGQMIGELNAVLPNYSMMAFRKSVCDASICLKFWKSSDTAWTSAITTNDADFVIDYRSGLYGDPTFGSRMFPCLRLTSDLADVKCDDVIEKLKNEIMQFRLSQLNLTN